VFFAIFLAAMGAAQAQLYFPDVAKGKAATQRVFHIIDRQPLIDATSQVGGSRQHTFPRMIASPPSSVVAASRIGVVPAQPSLGRRCCKLNFNFGAELHATLLPPALQEGAQPLEVRGEVELRDVTFAYPQRQGGKKGPGRLCGGGPPALQCGDHARCSLTLPALRYSCS
jgi:hypothetical protein